MPKRVAVPFKDTKLRIVGPAGNFWVHRVQRLDIPVNLPTTTIDELGNPQHVGTITDIPEVTSTFQAFDVSPKIFAYMTGTDPGAYPGAGVDVSELNYCDLIAYIKEADVNEHLKCIHARYMRVTDFTFTYSVDAESTEEYSLAGSAKKYFANDVVVDSGYLVSGEMTLNYTPNTLKNGEDLISMIVGGAWLDETAGDYSVVGTTVTVSGGASEYAMAVYHTSSGVMTWSNISDGTVPIAIRGKNIPVEIAANSMYRVQSVTIRGTFPNTKIAEMGNIEVVGYVADPPDVTGDITVVDTDNEIVALLSTGSIDGSGEDEYGVSEYEERTLQLDVIIKDPADNLTVLKTIRIPYMRITSDGTTSNVGEQLSYTFAFASDDAQCIVFEGAGT